MHSEEQMKINSGKISCYQTYLAAQSDTFVSLVRNLNSKNEYMFSRVFVFTN